MEAPVETSSAVQFETEDAAVRRRAASVGMLPAVFEGRQQVAFEEMMSADVLLGLVPEPVGTRGVSPVERQNTDQPGSWEADSVVSQKVVDFLDSAFVGQQTNEFAVPVEKQIAAQAA